MRFPLPPRKLELQRLLYPPGRPIYKDVDGVNDQDKYFIPDNVEGRKLRPIQTGRIFDFAGVEDITFSKNITSIIGWFDSGGGWDEAYDFSADISGAVFAPTGKVARLDVTFADASKAFLYCDDQSGLVAHDALTEGGNDGVIDVDGSSESSFHATDPEVPSRQNEVGHWFSGDAVGVGALTPIALDGNGKTDVLGNTVPHPYFGEVRKEALLTNASCMNFDGNLYETIPYKADWEISNFRCRIKMMLPTTNDNVDKAIYSHLFKLENISGWFIDFSTTQLRVVLFEQLFSNYVWIDHFGEYIEIDLVYFNNNYQLYINQNLDISGATTLGPYTNEIDLIIGGIVNFDNSVVRQLLQMNIYSIIVDELDVSGNLVKELLKFTGSEVNGLTFFNTAIDRPSNSDATVELEGSSDGDQYGDSEFARPNNILDGFTPVTYATGDQHVPADPANPGLDVQGNTLGVKGSSIAINPCESKVIFNPYGDPDLHAMGLTDTIELGYADIVANESIFHDNRVANKVEKLLAYSDFQYPVLGSSFQSDGNITISHPAIATNGVTQFEGTAEYTINGDTLELTEGLVYFILLGNGDFTYFSEEKGLLVYGMNGFFGAGDDNFTINLNGSADGDQWLLRSNKFVDSGINLNLNLQYGRYDDGTSLVPGDFTNFGFDILGNPIDNMEEVIKYRRIRQFLRK